MVERDWFFWNVRIRLSAWWFKRQYHFYRKFTDKRMCWMCGHVCSTGEYFESSDDWWGEKFPVYECEECTCEGETNENTKNSD